MVPIELAPIKLTHPGESSDHSGHEARKINGTGRERINFKFKAQCFLCMDNREAPKERAQEFEQNNSGSKRDHELQILGQNQ